MQRDVVIIKHFKIPTAQTTAVLSVLSQEVFYGYSSFLISLEQAENEKRGWEDDTPQTQKKSVVSKTSLEIWKRTPTLCLLYKPL